MTTDGELTAEERAAKLNREWMLSNFEGAERAVAYAIRAAEQAAAARERADCAEAAINAELPDSYQWGADALEAFEFGKAQAAKAIRQRGGEAG